MEKKKLMDENGEEVDAFPAEQVEAVLKEKTELESKLKETSEALSKMSNTDKDFKSLREAKETLEKELTDFKQKHEQEVNELKGAELAKHKSSLIDVFADKDANTKEKMEYHLKNSLAGMPETTKEQLDEKIKHAYVLATGQRDDDKINSIVSSLGKGSDIKPNLNGVKPELREAGKNFGLNDQDWENAKKANLI